jgi:hypothetical protein
MVDDQPADAARTIPPGAHTVQFTVASNAGGLCPVLVGVVGGGWSAGVYFRIEGGPPSCGITHQVPGGGDAKPGSRIIIQAGGMGSEASCPFTFVANLPPYTTLDATSITNGGVAGEGTITWSCNGCFQKGGTFAVIVDQDLPSDVTQLGDSGHASASYADGSAGSSDCSDTIPVVPRLTVGVQAQTAIFGQVSPGETITYTITASAADPVGSLSIQNAVPDDTDLVPGSISNGGTVSNGVLQWSFSNVASAQVSFQATVRTGAKLSPTATTIDDTADAQAILSDGSHESASDTLSLKLVRVTVTITAKVPKPGIPLVPGDTVQYTVTATVLGPASDITIQDTVPTYTALVGTVSPAAVQQGNGLTWSFHGKTSATAKFSAQVVPANQIPPDTEFIVDDATATASLGTAQAELAIPFGEFSITGKIFDVIANFPDGPQFTDERGLAGAIVEIFYPNEVPVQGAFQTTDSTGTFDIPVPGPGSYEIHYRGSGNRYANGTIYSAALTLNQEYPVTIPPTQKGPYPVPSALFLPVSLMDRVAALRRNLEQATEPFPGPLPGSSLPLELNTDQVDQFLAELVAAATPYDGAYEPSGDPNIVVPKDGWNALIRMVAAMAIIDKEFAPTADCVSDLSQGLATLVVEEVVKRLTADLASQYAINRPDYLKAYARIAGKGLTTLITNYYVPLFVNKLPLDAQTRNDLTAALNEAIGLLISTVTGEVYSDSSYDTLVASSAYALARVAMDKLEHAASNTNPFVGGAPSWQVLIYQASGLTSALQFDGGTPETLGLLNNPLKKSLTKLTIANVNASKALLALSNIRALRDAWQGFQELKTLKAGESITAKIATQAKNVGSVVSIPYYAASVVPPLVVVHLNQPTIQQMVNSAFSGIFTAPPKSAVAADLAPESVLTRGAALSAPFSDYLTWLGALDQAVAANDSTAIDTLGSQASDLEDALTAYLVPLEAQVAPALITTGTATKSLSTLAFAISAAAGQRELLYLEMAGLTTDDTLDTRTLVRNQIKATTKAVTQLATAGGSGSQTLPTFTIPGTPVIEPELPTGDVVNAGDTVTFTFHVVNVGSTALAEGQIKLDLTGPLTLTSTRELDLPALDPGASTDVSWTAQASTDGLPASANYFVTALAADAPPGVYGDTVLVVGP